MLIDKIETTGLKHLNDSAAFIAYSNDNYNYKNIEEYNPNKERKILIKIVDMLSNKNLNPIATELFLRGRKLNIYYTILFYCTKRY